MSINENHIADIREAELEGLVSAEVSEGKTIEYKVRLPGGTDADKKEFLADVSSFANSSGGDIVFGMSEENGIAKELVGLSCTNPDAEKLRLEEIFETA